MYGTKNKTRKDWRNREWPAGKNNIWYKKKFCKLVRKWLKRKYDILLKGNEYKKLNNSWDINDFK